MANDCLISVIAPAFNAAVFYDAWLHSIQVQDHRKIEVILIDDGSTDTIAEFARNAPPFLRYVRQKNRGPAAARNTGIRAASGELIAFLDLDDLWAPSHLRHLSDALEADQDAQIAQGLIRNFAVDANGLSFFISRPYRFINLGASVFRRCVFDLCGPFDEQMRFAEDYDFMFRCWEQGVLKRDLNQLSLLYRRHDRNMTIGKNSVEIGGLAVYKRHLERLRAGQISALPRNQVRYPEYIGRSPWPFDEGIREPM